MSRIADQVQNFHETFGIPNRTDTGPTGYIPETALRVALMLEECAEYQAAAEAADVVEIADALADIVYVAYGTALAHGIDLDAVLDEVHSSNMSKIGADGVVLLRPDGKVMKGPGYFRPDIARVLGFKA